MGAWGSCPGSPKFCVAEISGSASVKTTWGSCPGSPKFCVAGISAERARRRGPRSDSGQLHVLELVRKGIDALQRRRDPVGHLARLGHRHHEALHVGLVGVAGEPLVAVLVP